MVGVNASAGVAVPFILAARRSRVAALGAAAGLAVVVGAGWALFASPAAGLGATLADARHVTKLSVPGLASRALGRGAVPATGVRLAFEGAAALVAGRQLWRVARGAAEPLDAAGWATLAVLAASTWLLPW